MSKVIDMAALYDEDATLEEQVVVYQHIVNTGDAWQLEGSVGRSAMNLIEQGYVMLGEEAHCDYWGNQVPSRFEVQEGTKGSEQFVRDRHPEVLEEEQPSAAQVAEGYYEHLSADDGEVL